MDKKLIGIGALVLGIFSFLQSLRQNLTIPSEAYFIVGIVLIFIGIILLLIPQKSGGK